MALHKVRETVGDKIFFEILRAWTKKYRHGNVETKQFITLCQEKAGKDLSHIFAAWLTKDEKPAM